MEQLTDLKKDILVDNALDWKKFKILITVCCSYVVGSTRLAVEFLTRFLKSLAHSVEIA